MSSNWLRYNITGKYIEESTDGGGSFHEMDLSYARKCSSIDVSATGSQNNFALPGGRVQSVRFTNGSLATFTGFLNGAANQDGDLLFCSAVASQVNFVHESTSSTSGNRLSLNATTAAAPTSLAGGTGTAITGTAIFIYLSGSLRWKLIQHDQGAWITPAYASGDYTAGGGGTWTVGSGDVVTYAYWLKDRSLYVNYRWATTTLASTPSVLNAKIPGGFVSAKTVDWISIANNNGTFHAALSQCAAAGTTMNFFSNEGGSGWGNATDNSGVSGQAVIEVQ